MCIDISCCNKPNASDFIRAVPPRLSPRQRLEPTYSDGSPGGASNVNNGPSSSAIIPCESGENAISRQTPQIPFQQTGRSQIISSQSPLMTNAAAAASTTATAAAVAPQVKIEQMRQLREAQARHNVPFPFQATPSHPLSPSSNLGSGYYELLNNEAQRPTNQQELVNSIQRAISEEQKRAIEEIQRLSRESASLYNNHGLSMEHSDLARLIQEKEQQLKKQQLEQQLRLFGSSALGDASARNLTPQQEVTLSSIISRAYDGLNQQQGCLSNVNPLLNNNSNIIGGPPNNSSLGMDLPDPAQSLQERGRIHSQIMSAALRGLFYSGSQQDASATTAGAFSSGTANLEGGMNSLTYDRNVLDQQQRQQLLPRRGENTNNVNDIPPAMYDIRNQVRLRNLLSGWDGISDQQQQRHQLPLSMQSNIPNQLQGASGFNELINSAQNQTTGPTNDLALMMELVKRNRNM